MGCARIEKEPGFFCATRNAWTWIRDSLEVLRECAHDVSFCPSFNFINAVKG